MVKSIDVKTGVTETFDNAVIAAKELNRISYPNADQSSICRCCTGLGNTAYGRTWEYAQ